MQDFMSSGLAPYNFAPSLSTNFTSKAYDLLPKQPAPPKSSSRGEVIFLQERKIRNDFLRKAGQKSTTTKSSTGTHSQREKVNSNSAFRLKLVASAVAVGLVLFAAQLGSSFLRQQLTTHELSQSSAIQPVGAPSFGHAIPSVQRTATTASGAAQGTAMSLDTFHQSHKIEDLIAAAQATNVGPTTKPAQAIESAPKPEVKDLALNSIGTSELVKIGYQKLRTGDAKESISILTEAVRRDCNDPTSRRYLGYALIQAGRPAEALEQYSALQKLSGLLPTDQLAMQHALRVAQAKS